MVTITKQLGGRIRSRRTERGLTQEELAHRARLDFSYLKQIENAPRNPSLDAIGRIARALGVPARDLISF